MTITGPVSAHAVSTPDAYERRQLDAARRLGVLVHPARGRAAAYVSHGRWVCDCGECGNGASVSLEWGVARCFECGAVYAIADATLQLPDADAQAAIVEALLERSDAKHRNWRSPETVADLRLETAAFLGANVPMIVHQEGA